MASIFSKKISRRVLRFLFWYSASAKVNWLMIRLAGLKNGRCGYYRKKWRVIQRLRKKDYIGELDKYLQELSVCKEVVKEYAIKYRELFDSSFLHLYEANFDIFNKGSMYDEK